MNNFKDFPIKKLDLPVRKFIELYLNQIENGKRQQRGSTLTDNFSNKKAGAGDGGRAKAQLSA